MLIRFSLQRDQRGTKNEEKQTRFIWLFQEDYLWLSNICTEKIIACRKNGWEGTLADVTLVIEFNNDKDSKKVLNNEAEKTNKVLQRHAMDVADSMPLNMHLQTKSNITRQNKWAPFIPSDWIGFCGADDS